MVAHVSEDWGRQVKRPGLVEALAEAEAGILSELDTARAELLRAVEAALLCDAKIADQVTALDADAEQRFSEAHDQLLAVIARQAPVAGDLRLAIALLHVNDRIARMSAQSMNIATLCRAIPSGQRPSADQLGCLATMARFADEQISEAGRVFAERDLEGASRLREHDLRINEHNRRCFELALREGDEPDRRQIAFFVALMARAIERIGDNAVDIGQQVLFTVTGRLRNS
jgi:phosphate transport system protein